MQTKTVAKKTVAKKAEAKVSAKSTKKQNPLAITGGHRTGEAINEEDKLRAFRDYQKAVERGFVFQRGLAFALGEPVNAIGQANMHRLRQEFDDLPLADEVITKAAATIVAEERDNGIEVELQDLRMDESGALYSQSKYKQDTLNGSPASPSAQLGAGLFLTPWAFQALVEKSQAPKFASAYLSQVEPDLRAVNMNRHLPLLEKSSGLPTPVRLRTRTYGGQRQIFGVLSKSYRTSMDCNNVLEAMRPHILPGSKATFAYDGQRWEMRVFSRTAIKPEQAVAGEIFEAGIYAWGSDDGKYGLHVGSFVRRNLCKNIIIIEDVERDMWTTHVRTNLADVVKGMMERAVGAVSGFAEAWNEARTDQILERIYGSHDVAPIFAELVKADLVRVPGCDRDELVSRLVTAWNLEPGWTRADLVNAITRAAHTNAWADPWATTHLEKQAGELMTAHVAIDWDSYFNE